MMLSTRQHLDFLITEAADLQVRLRELEEWAVEATDLLEYLSDRLKVYETAEKVGDDLVLSVLKSRKDN